jgi:hypothetical protein
MTYRISDITNLILEISHVNLLLLPRLFGPFKAKQSVKDMFMWNYARITPLGRAGLAAGLPFHLFFDFCSTHISGLFDAFEYLFFGPSVCAATVATAALLQC